MLNNKEITKFICDSTVEKAAIKANGEYTLNEQGNGNVPRTGVHTYTKHGDRESTTVILCRFVDSGIISTAEHLMFMNM